MFSRLVIPVCTKDSGGDIFIIGVYVDHIVLVGRTDKEIEEIKTALPV